MTTIPDARAEHGEDKFRALFETTSEIDKKLNGHLATIIDPDTLFFREFRGNSSRSDRILICGIDATIGPFIVTGWSSREDTLTTLGKFAHLVLDNPHVSRRHINRLIDKESTDLSEFQKIPITTEDLFNTWTSCYLASLVTAERLFKEDQEQELQEQRDRTLQEEILERALDVVLPK